MENAWGKAHWPSSGVCERSGKPDPALQQWWRALLPSAWGQPLLRRRGGFEKKRFLKGNVALFREIATMTENVRASLSVARITA